MTHRPNLIPPPRDEGINPPPLLTRVEVEDVEHDDENVDNDKNEESDNAPSTNLGGGERIDENAEAAPQLDRGTRVCNPPDYYQADFTNMKYDYPDEADVIHTCFQRAGYGAKDKLKTECRSAGDHTDRIMKDNPPPVGFTEEQLDNHIMGVVMAEHFSLKRGIKLFGSRAEEATTKELRAIHDMGTYEPLDASKLTREDKAARLCLSFSPFLSFWCIGQFPMPT